VVLTNLLPFIFMCFLFTFIYKFVPYTTVKFSSALVGGITAGIIWQVAGMAFASFVVGTGRYSAIYSSFAILILFLIWLYFGWLIVLAGAQVAYYHQHPSAYLLHLRRKNQTPLFREYLTLALLTHITRRFLTGKPPLKEEQLARAQRVPLTLVESLINDLVKAKVIARGDEPKGLILAQSPESITIVDVLKVVQHQPQSGPQAFAVGTDDISRLLIRRDTAVAAALEGITLRNLVGESQTVDQNAPGESTFGMESEAADRNASSEDPAVSSELSQDKTQSHRSPIEKRRL
jgi:membrane protein